MLAYQQLESCVFFFNDTATTEIYTNLNTPSLHDALPICSRYFDVSRKPEARREVFQPDRSEEHTSELQSHSEISYAVFCLKKKKKEIFPKCPQKAALRRRAMKSKKATSARNFWLKWPNAKTAFLLMFFFFNDTATTEIYTNLNTLSLHDALPICLRLRLRLRPPACRARDGR